MSQRIAIFGSGAIGCYAGGWLQHAGAEVVFIGSPRIQKQVQARGLVLSDIHQRRLELAPATLTFTVDPGALSDADLILVCVKSGATPAAAAAIRSFAKPSACVISLQNGIGNAKVIADLNPFMTILGGMVPFNVAHLPGGGLFRATEGEIVVEPSHRLASWLPLFAAAGLPLTQRMDFVAVQWGKLLLNLNNPINALSGLPLKSQLQQRDYRRCLAALIRETLGVLRAAGIQPARVGRVRPTWLPFLLELPNPLFERVARQMLRIDPQARSSMWDDLHAGRATEIDFLSGAVAALAATSGCEAPINRRIAALIHHAETQAVHTPIDGSKLWRSLREVI